MAFQRWDCHSREIVRRTGLSRNTVRKYLSSGDVEPRYPKRKMPSKLDAYEATLRCWLQRESFLRRKDRRCIGEMHVDLVCLGYSGSYDRVAAFALSLLLTPSGAETAVFLVSQPLEHFRV